MSPGNDDYPRGRKSGAIVDMNHEILVSIPEFLPRLVKLLKLQSNHVPFGHRATQQILHSLHIPDALLPLLEVTDGREDWESEDGLNLEHAQLLLRDTVRLNNMQEDNDGTTSNENELRSRDDDMNVDPVPADEGNAADNRALNLSGLKVL